MDGIVIILIAFVLLVIFRVPADAVELDNTGVPIEHIEINPRLNPEMIHDEQAFMKIANELGFH